MQARGTPDIESVKKIAADESRFKLNKSQALMRISCKALSDALGLPETVIIDAAFMDATDMQCDTVTLRVRGIGETTPEGGQHKYVSIESVVKDGQ